jgi:flagellar M-ring protein FliF
VEKERSPGQIFAQIGDFLRGLPATQQALLLVGALAVAATLFVFVRMIEEPKYVTLYSGLRAQDAQELASRLTAKSIANRLGSDGASLMVPTDKLDAARLETASQGLPRNARMGFELFDTPNWAGSDFTEKVNYQRALEGELERTLQTLSEVEAVRVHLVLPHDSLFSEQDHGAKAAVIVKTRTGALSMEAQGAIPQLVASAVEKLRPEDVTVVDADSDASLVRPHGMLGGTASSELDQQLAQAIVHTLEPVVGADHVRASVHVEYDPSSSEHTEETYDPKAVATLATQHAEETAGGTAGGGIPGTASNVPGSQPGSSQPGGTPPANGATAGGSDSDHQASRSDSASYAVSKTTNHVLQPAGRLKRLTAAVLVDDAVDTKDEDGKKTETRRHRTPDEMKELVQLAGAAIGVDGSRGDLLAVENISFRENPVETPVAPGTLEKIRALLRDWADTLRYVGVTLLFLFVYLMVLRPVKKQALAAFQQLPARARAAAVGAGIADLKSGQESATGSGAALITESDDGRRAKLLKQQLADRVKAEPAAASRLVQTWIKEG